jgi:hypothetical protein
VRLAACAETNFPADPADYGFSSPSLLSLGYGGFAPGAAGFVTLVREDLDIQAKGDHFNSRACGTLCNRSSVADPGSGIRCLFDIPDPGWVKIKIRIRNEHLGSYSRELGNSFLG